MCTCQHNVYTCGHSVHIRTLKCELELLREQAIPRPSDIEAAEDEYLAPYTPAAIAESMRPGISRLHSYLDEMSYPAEECKECKKYEDERKRLGVKKEKDVVKWRKE